MGLELTSRQWFLLVLFAVVNLLNGAIFTLQAPFYPIEVSTILSFWNSIETIMT